MTPAKIKRVSHATYLFAHRTGVAENSAIHSSSSWRVRQKNETIIDGSILAMSICRNSLQWNDAQSCRDPRIRNKSERAQTKYVFGHPLRRLVFDNGAAKVWIQVAQLRICVPRAQTIVQIYNTKIDRRTFDRGKIIR